MASPVVLVPATAFAERWWTPPAATLARIGPGVQVKVRAVELEADGRADLFRSRPVWISVEAREGDVVEGPILRSSLDREGYRKGDRLRTTLDRLCDVVFVDDHGRPEFDEERARFGIGKRVLVGITNESREGKLVGQRQFVGVLTSVDAVKGLTLTLSSGETYNLPPDLTTLEEAPPGEYRLRSTGEIVVDPDYTCTWVSSPNEDSPSAS
jgi:hypothetical protein